MRLGVEFKIPAGSHIYFKEPGDSGRPSTLEWTLPAGSNEGKLLWPKPERFQEEGLTSYGYSEKLLLASEVTIPADWKSSTFPVKARVSWLLCGKGSCVPGETELSLELPVGTSPGAASTEAAMLQFQEFRGSVSEIGSTTGGGGNNPGTDEPGSGISLAYAIFLGFLAGILLNLMPCVLPVIALKVLSFSKQAGQDRAASLRLGLAYTLGTLATFAAMATAMVTARAVGSSLGWGFQFQSLSYLVGMSSIICLMTLSMFGLFYVQVQTGVQTLESTASKNGFLAAFARGISATLLSTPCSAPLLGTALGFALSQPAVSIFAVLLSVGLGLSAPYLLLSAFPRWLKFLPKPGMWMERFKEAMGFLMLGTLVWMLSVIAKVGGAAAVTGSITFLFCLTLAAWAYVRFASSEAALWRRVLVIAASLLLCGGSFYHNVWTLNPETVSQKEAVEVGGVRVLPYSETELQKQLSEGKIVFVDATAEWCLTCKLNEKVLGSETVRQEFQKRKIVVLQADWTRGDEKVSALLKSFGRPGVPMYVIYSPGKKPVLLPELLTPGIVTDAITEAAR